MKNSTLLFDLIRSRRSLKPPFFNGQVIDDGIIREMIEAATWAPTHGLTQPWRFKVYTGAALSTLATTLSATYVNIAQEKATEEIQKRLSTMPNLSSHVIVISYAYNPESNIPEWEELAATSAAVQNLHLMATAHNVVGVWTSPGFLSSPKFNEALDIASNQKVVGIFYLGYTDKELPPSKRKAIDEVMTWVNS
jgi:nitroreductase